MSTSAAWYMPGKCFFPQVLTVTSLALPMPKVFTVQWALWCTDLKYFIKRNFVCLFNVPSMVETLPHFIQSSIVTIALTVNWSLTLFLGHVCIRLLNKVCFFVFLGGGVVPWILSCFLYKIKSLKLSFHSYFKRNVICVSLFLKYPKRKLATLMSRWE